MHFLVLATCQGQTIKRCIEARGQHTVEHLLPSQVEAASLTKEMLAGFDAVIAHHVLPERAELWARVNDHPRVINFPMIFFAGLTPDFMTFTPGSISARASQSSRIVAAAKVRGFTPEATRELFNPEFISAMRYRDVFSIQRRVFLENLSTFTSRAEYLFENWQDRGVFFHTANHPKMYVIADLLRDILRNNDLDILGGKASDILVDPLEQHLSLPNLNHSHATNLMDRQDHVYRYGTGIVDLEENIARVYKEMGAAGPSLEVDGPDLARFDKAYSDWTARTPEPLDNPYRKQPASKFWAKAVARPKLANVRPGDAVTPIIGPTTRVATAGSCFAQHVARAMVSDGLNYYVAEAAPEGMDAQTAADRGYGLFSARYGNIYSTRQLLQLIQRAFGKFHPVETAWKTKDGYIDPFRPNIGETFETVEALEAARADHLSKVREMFETLDVFVFTLGLTEGWYDKRDGSAFPVTPGAVTNSADPAHFEFQNHDYSTVSADLSAFLGELFKVNSTAKVVLTVSPVPLIATYSENHVLEATTYSKSVLRCVAGDAAKAYAAVQYFPSYEIIVGPHTRGEYYEDNLREVRKEGVAHVMDVFREKLVIRSDGETASLSIMPEDEIEAVIVEEARRQQSVVCDEELLVAEWE